MPAQREALWHLYKSWRPNLLEVLLIKLHEVDDFICQALALDMLPGCDSLTKRHKRLNCALQDPMGMLIAEHVQHLAHLACK